MLNATIVKRRGVKIVIILSLVKMVTKRIDRAAKIVTLDHLERVLSPSQNVCARIRWVIDSTCSTLTNCLEIKELAPYQPYIFVAG